VLARCFGIESPQATAATEKVLWSLAESLLPENDIVAYTQGLMDLGATLCVRRAPLCTACPMYELCIARSQGRQAELPTPRAKKALPERETELLLLTDGQRILLERRPPAGIWGGLLSLPEGGVAEARAYARRHGFRLLGMRPMAGVKHSFTHFRLQIQTLLCTVAVSPNVVAETGWQWLAYAEIETAALPTPIRRLLREGVKMGAIRLGPRDTSSRRHADANGYSRTE
jgi:A/G-specific adenine glycosylase